MFVRANIMKGRKALAAHQPEQAAADFKTAMEYPEDLGTGQPDPPELSEQFYWLGVALAAQNKTAEATKAWEAATHSGKTDVFAALAYRKLGQNDRAQQILAQRIEAATRPDPVAGTLYAAGLAEQFQGNKARALEDFHRTLVRDPLYWAARVAMAEMDAPDILHASL
jgi:tetratricopeptide (TPR) repeat protein